MEAEWADNLQCSALSFPTPASTSEWPSQEQHGSGLTVSGSPCTDGYGLLCGLWVWRRRTNRRIDLLIDCTVWRFWTMRQSNGCSTSAPRSSAAYQCFEELAQKKKNQPTVVLMCGGKYFLSLLQSWGDNWLWHRFHKCIIIFTLCVDCVGQT